MKKHQTIKLTALMLTLFVIEKAILHFWLKAYDFTLLPAIPLFFIVFGHIAFYFYTKKAGNITVFMAMKTLKILLSMVILLVYVLLVKSNSVAFLVSYLIYFTAYLSFETWMLATINKKK